MSDQYTYPSETLKKLAIEQLNENPDQVNAHIESFRRWVKSMPHLHCPTDAKFLLMFLRVAKFDHEKAQKRLDNFCTIRSSERGHPEFFDKIDDSLIEKVCKTNLNVPVGLTVDNKILLIGKMDKWNPKELHIKDLMKVIFLGMEMLMLHEETQVCGIKYFGDMEKSSKALLEAIGDTKILKDTTRVWQDCYPIRIKGQIIYNEPAWYSIVMNVMEFFLHDKHKKRLYRVKNNLPKAFEHIPGLKTLLPKEMGGENISLNELGEKHLQNLREFLKKGSPFADIKVDESKRPAETMKFLTHYADYTGKISTGTDGSFTKFDAF